MTRVKNLAKTGLALIGVLATPASAFANKVSLNLSGDYANVSSWNIQRFATAAIQLILIMAGLVAFFFFLYGGLQWILAGGDKEGTEKARKRITASLIGLVIVFATYAFIGLVGQFLGVSLTNFNVPNV